MSSQQDENAPGTPPVIVKAVRLWVAAAVLCALAACAWLLLRRPLGLPRGGVYRFIPAILGLAPIVVLLPFWHWRVRSLRRALFASGFRLCTHCAYDVSTLAPAGTCPECGHPYDSVRDVELWARQGAPYTEPRPPGFTPWSLPESVA